MSDLKPKGTSIKLGKEEYGLRFTLNVIDDIQDKFNIAVGDMGKLFEDEKTRIKNLKGILMLMINEDIDCVKDETGEERPHVDERFIGRHIHAGNMNQMVNSILASARKSSPDVEEESAGSPNRASE